MTRAELYDRARHYARWRRRGRGHRLLPRGVDAPLSVLTALPEWTEEAADRADALAADAGLAVAANRAAVRLDADRLRAIAADIGDERLDALIALPAGPNLPEDGETILQAALEGTGGDGARDLIAALLRQAPATAETPEIPDTAQSPAGDTA